MYQHVQDMAETPPPSLDLTLVTLRAAAEETRLRILALRRALGLRPDRHPGPVPAPDLAAPQASRRVRPRRAAPGRGVGVLPADRPQLGRRPPSAPPR